MKQLKANERSARAQLLQSVECAGASIHGADSQSPDRSQNSYSGMSTSPRRECDRPSSTSRTRRALGIGPYRLALLILLTVFAAAVWLSTYYLDYEYLGFVASRALRGQSIESCLDLPERYWSRIPQCWDRPQPQRGGEKSTAS